MAEATKLTIQNGWVYGRVGKYSYTAKVLKKPKPYCINGGQIAVLAIFDDEKRVEYEDFREGEECEACLAYYDRQWRAGPLLSGNKDYQVFQRILGTLETTAQRGYAPLKTAQ